MAFATTTLVLSLYNVGVQSIVVPNAIVCFAVFYGGLIQYLAGLWEFASGE
jgi:succinate-acetate transporter protein